MRTILCVISDVLFQSRVREQGLALGYDVVMLDVYDKLLDSLAARPACLVIDLHVAGIDWREAVAAAAKSGVPVLAFGRHTEAALLREARAAGCERVVPRSALAEELREMLGEPTSA